MSEPDVWRVRDLLEWTADYFSRHDLGTARLDAEVLLAHALQRERLWLYMEMERAVPLEALPAFRGYVKRRSMHEPVAYIVGEKEFYSLPFHVTPAVLVPRPETEVLLEVAFERLTDTADDAPLRLADVGTGSGVIAVTLASELGARVGTIDATDVSDAAIHVARENAQRHGVEEHIQFRLGEGLDPLESPNCYHAILSNPPYIASGDIDGLDADVRRYEPTAALDGGEDGLDVIRAIVTEAGAHLAPEGLLALEVGAGQASEACHLIEKTGAFQRPDVRRDYANLDRVVSARRQS